jgi:hypothetical protein
MTHATARRILLAFLDGFDYVAEITLCVSQGVPVPEDFGFTPAEIRRAQEDRAAIARRYGELKLSRSFLAASIGARLEYLSGVRDGEGGEMGGPEG